MATDITNRDLTTVNQITEGGEQQSISKDNQLTHNNKLKLKENIMDALIGWIGGKRLLRKTISQLIPADIDAYVEPFGGAAWVMLYKERWADLEVYNDLDDRLVNLFLQVKYHPDELIKELSMTLASRSLFYRIIKQEGLTEIQKAARFMFLISRSFGGKGEHFGTSKKQGASSLYNRLERIKQLNKRLDRVIIENLSYEQVFEKYDAPNNLFYCDPPYVTGCTYSISKHFDHQLLRDALGKLKGKFVLSYDDCPEVLKLYEGYPLMHVSRVKGINRKEGKSDYAEVIITNYPITKEIKA